MTDDANLLKTGPRETFTDVVFVDTETTGLDPDRHEIWEVAAIYWGGESWIERAWQLPVDLGRADSMALKIGRFHQRRQKVREWPELDYFSANFASITRGKHLAGAVISFDEERLRKLLRANGACPEWHYHLIDVEALATGYLAAQGKALPLPWDSEDLSRALGIEPDTNRHEALYDAQWAKQIYEAVMFGG